MTRLRLVRTDGTTRFLENETTPEQITVDGVIYKPSKLGRDNGSGEPPAVPMPWTYNEVTDTSEGHTARRVAPIRESRDDGIT